MRKRSWIFLLCMLVTSIISFTNAEAKFIGPNGGIVEAGHGCTLQILSESIGNPETASYAMENADEILANLDNEWITHSRTEIDNAKIHLAKEHYKNAHDDIESALEYLKKAKDELEKARSKGKTSPVKLIAEAEGELLVAQEALGLDITASSRITQFEYKGETYKFLEFEFGPTGAEFSPAAILTVPFNQINESDLIILYQFDGKLIDIIDLECEIDKENCEIDKENEVVRFYIPGFSYYYFRRR